jgi:hypothetical protein
MRLGESGRVNLRDLAYEVPPGHFFAVGDNINSSYDSFQFGPLPLDRIRGRLRFIYWPPTRMGRAVLPHGKIPSHPKVEHQGDGGIK